MESVERMRFSTTRRAGAISRRHILAVLATGMAVLSSADPSRAAEEEALLRVVPQNGPALELRLAQLDALPQVLIVTETIWTEGEIHFTGPALTAVLAQAGITSGTVRLSALNDFVIDLDLAKLGVDWPIIATRINGHTFGVRDNGPLWLIYPYDRGGAFANDETYASSVWQLLMVEATGP